MQNLYGQILKAKQENKKLLAILLDPDKIDWDLIDEIGINICKSPATHVFIGGSLVLTDQIDRLINAVKSKCDLPVILFPGNPSQISTAADGLLFLSLLSGTNPEYLIGHHIIAAPILKKTNLEIIPTGYVLIESGAKTAVEIVTQTEPLPRENSDIAVATAIAGEMLGNKLIYLEAGSGARLAVPQETITRVSQEIKIPLIVGGGITTLDGIQAAYEAGADLVVIGTAFENDIEFFNKHK